MSLWVGREDRGETDGPMESEGSRFGIREEARVLVTLLRHYLDAVLG